jgi:DNA-binding MarR family transcriptional regulator
MKNSSDLYYPNLENKVQIERFQKFNERNFVRLTRQIYRQVTNNINTRLESCGFSDLSARHLSVFDHLDAHGTNIVTLASRAGISKQAMSKLVRETSQAGYVSVETDKNDSRISNVSFNEKGLGFLEILQTEINKAREVILENESVTKEDMSSTISTLSKILTYFEASDDIFASEVRAN